MRGASNRALIGIILPMTPTRQREGNDTIQNFEARRFADVNANMRMALTAKSITAPTLKSLEESSVAYSNRMPDAERLQDCMPASTTGRSLLKNGASVYAAAVLPSWSTLTGYSATRSNTDAVKIIYQHGLGRSTVDPECHAYWNVSLATDMKTGGSLISTILDAAHMCKGDRDVGYVADLLDNKILVANRVAVQEGISFIVSASQSYATWVAHGAAIAPMDTRTAITLVGTNHNSRNVAQPDATAGDVR